MNQLSQRSARITDDQTAEIVRLAIRQLPYVEIAKRAGVHRNTVSRVLKRTRAALTINADLEIERSQAVALYREIQRTAWEGVEAVSEEGRVPVRLLAEIRQCQTRIDAFLGLAPAGPDDPTLVLAQLKQTIVHLVLTEAPQLAPVLAQRLQALSERN